MSKQSLNSMYENLISELHERIEGLTSKKGIIPAFRANDVKFLEVSSFEIQASDTPIAFINHETALSPCGLEFSIRCFEANGELESLIEGIDRLTEEVDTYSEDEQEGPFVFIRGYRDEEDLDAQRSESIDAITEEEWENGKGNEIIEDNESEFYHIEVTNEDGKLLS